ncbi:hypothetical protein [Paenibacillus polymyxa]|uniref:hypothetical protein n=1 Tax=Paenibacillus polymyxa TaxID=1406 RepID=UPI00298BCA35|nr:hypothetical protein [Paenibacillus polymyxa]
MNSIVKLSLASLLVLGLGVASFPLSTSADSAKEGVQKKIETNSTIPSAMGFNFSITNYATSESSITLTGTADVSLSVNQYLDLAVGVPTKATYQLVGQTNFPQIITIDGNYQSQPATKVFSNVPAGTYKLRIIKIGEYGVLNAHGLLSTY